MANDLGRLSDVARRIPHMHVGIGAIIAGLGQPRMANRFSRSTRIASYSERTPTRPREFPTYFRVLESSDEYFPYYKRYHAFWRMYGLDLPDEILKKLYYKNALRIIPGLNTSFFLNDAPYLVLMKAPKTKQFFLLHLMRKLRYRRNELRRIRERPPTRGALSDLSVERFIDYAEQPFWHDSGNHDVIDTAAEARINASYKP